MTMTEYKLRTWRLTFRVGAGLLYFSINVESASPPFSVDDIARHLATKLGVVYSDKEIV